MTRAPSTRRWTDELSTGLRTALRKQGFTVYASCDLLPLGDKGLAHDHIRILGADTLLRIPKQSQMRLRAMENLAYEACCYERATRSGVTPMLVGMLYPSEELPRGALLVEEVYGRAVDLPSDLPAIMRSLARLHALPLPEASARAPLLDPADPIQAILSEIVFQQSYIGASGIDGVVKRMIERNIEKLKINASMLSRPPKRLIAFDTHPGNFRIRADGVAVLVDLEKCRYSYPALDLAHTTLYSSTTWDVETYAELSVGDVVSAYAEWRKIAGPYVDDHLDWYASLRRAMWLWSLTWCVKWLATSKHPPTMSGDGEDWSAEKSDQELIRHVHERVDHFLSPPAVRRMAAELDELESVWDTLIDRRPVTSHSVSVAER